MVDFYGESCEVKKGKPEVRVCALSFFIFDGKTLEGSIVTTICFFILRIHKSCFFLLKLCNSLEILTGSLGRNLFLKRKAHFDWIILLVIWSHIQSGAGNHITYFVVILKCHNDCEIRESKACSMFNVFRIHINQYKCTWPDKTCALLRKHHKKYIIRRISHNHAYNWLFHILTCWSSTWLSWWPFWWMFCGV